MVVLNKVRLVKKIFIAEIGMQSLGGLSGNGFVCVKSHREYCTSTSRKILIPVQVPQVPEYNYAVHSAPGFIQFRAHNKNHKKKSDNSDSFYLDRDRSRNVRFAPPEPLATGTDSKFVINKLTECRTSSTYKVSISFTTNFGIRLRS